MTDHSTCWWVQTDLGTGSDTVLAQMAAEVLGVPVMDMIVYSSDTDFTLLTRALTLPALHTFWRSGGKGCEQVAERIKLRAARMLNDQISSSSQGNRSLLVTLPNRAISSLLTARPQLPMAARLSG